MTARHSTSAPALVAAFLATTLLAGPAGAADYKGSLSAEGSIGGPFCHDFDPKISRHVKRLCLDKVDLRWKIGFLLGEPVIFARARWRAVISEIILRTNASVDARTASTGVREAFAGVYPIDFTLLTKVKIKVAAGVNRPSSCSQDDLSCNLKRGGLDWPAHLIIDAGALGKSGEWSFNTPSSPSWGKLFVSSLLGGYCAPRWKRDGIPAKFHDAKVAIAIVRVGLTLEKLQGCRISFGGIGALNRALVATCEAYKGDTAAQQKCMDKKKDKQARKKKPGGEDAFDKAIARAEKIAEARPGKKKGPFAAAILKAERKEKQAGAEKLERERLEKERLAKEKLERERLAKERLEKEKLETERLEKERLAKETLERERLEKERLSKESSKKQLAKKGGACTTMFGKEKLSYAHLSKAWSFDQNHVHPQEKEYMRFLANASWRQACPGACNLPTGGIGPIIRLVGFHEYYSRLEGGLFHKARIDEKWKGGFYQKDAPGKAALTGHVAYVRWGDGTLVDFFDLRESSQGCLPGVRVKFPLPPIRNTLMGPRRPPAFSTHNSGLEKYFAGSKQIWLEQVGTE